MTVTDTPADFASAPPGTLLLLRDAHGHVYASGCRCPGCGAALDLVANRLGGSREKPSLARLVYHRGGCGWAGRLSEGTWKEDR